MAEHELTTQKSGAGLPFRKQIFGGYRKTDVTEYIENLVAMAETDRAEIEEEKKQFYDLMKHGMAFCEKLTLDSQERADALMDAAQKSVDGLMDAARKNAEGLVQDANDQAAQLNEEYRQVLAQARTDAGKLTGVLKRQQQDADEHYAQLLQPLNALLNTWGTETDAP